MTVKANIASVLMTNGESVSDGKMSARSMWKSWIITKGSKMDSKLQEIHPGEILLEEFLKPMGITNARLASDIDVPTSRISEIINGKRPVTVDTAMRLSVYFNMEARFWLNLQAEYDVRMAEANLLPEIKRRIRPLESVAG